MKRGQIVIEQGKPLQFLETVESNDDPQEGASDTRKITATLKAYRAAATALLTGKYASFAPIAPKHLANAADILVLRCIDGVIVRYDRSIESEPKIRAGVTTHSLCDMATPFSERLVYFGRTAAELNPETDGIRLTVGVGELGRELRDGQTTALAILANHLPAGIEIPRPPNRPTPLVSITNEFDVEMEGAIVPAGQPLSMEGPDVDQFVAHTRMRFPVGWEAFEIYPLLPEEYWNPQFSAIWAEMDILATVARHNLQLEKLNALDSRGETRQRYAALLHQFESLLQGPEEPVHQFLKQHPELISPTCEKSWSKLAFGDRVSDFVFREPHNDYELVELEAPIRELFRNDGQQRQELTHAINQIADWLQYIEDNKAAVEALGLNGISTSPRTLIVIGRSESLTDENRRKLTTLQNQFAKMRILTYDDLLAAARANLERILGPMSLVAGENVRICYFR